jgi:hypothetical protein
MTCRFEGVIHFAGLKVAEEKSSASQCFTCVMPICKFIVQVQTTYVFALSFLTLLTTFGTFLLHKRCDTLSRFTNVSYFE